jgi:hypothetical protein
MNMGDFKYDAESDPVYQQYKQQYMQQGQQAMRDTMGQAAALTGGYGNTYAQQAGEQAYAAYLSRLNDVLPELYGDAYNRDYNTWRDQLGDQRYYEQLAYDRDQAQLDRDWQQKQWDYNVQQDTQNHSYNLAMQMIQSGQVPDAGMLQAAGIDAAYAQKMAGWYARQLAGAGGGSGSGSGSGGAGGGSGSGSGSGGAGGRSGSGSGSGGTGGRSGSGSGSGGSGKTYAPATNAEIDAFARRYAHTVNNKLNDSSDYSKAMMTDFENRFGADNDVWTRIRQWAIDRGYIRGYQNAH